MKRKTTLDARLAAARRQAADAISTFERAAVDLEHSAAAQQAVAAEIDDQITLLFAMRTGAVQQADSSLQAAERIRGLLG